MTDVALPTVLIPGLLCSPRVYAEQLAPLWTLGPVMVADHRRDDSMAAIARRVLAAAPPRFALAGLSMGGYIALEIMRQAPERVSRLLLLSTSARPDTPEQTERRRTQIAIAQGGRFETIAGLMFPSLIHPSRHGDATLRDTIARMAAETGAEAFVKQQTAILGRMDSRDSLRAIRCPTLVVAAADDALISPEYSAEMADRIPGARLVTVPDCGHLSTLDQPQELVRVLLSFLSEGQSQSV